MAERNVKARSKRSISLSQPANKKRKFTQPAVLPGHAANPKAPVEVEVVTLAEAKRLGFRLPPEEEKQYQSRQSNKTPVRKPPPQTKKIAKETATTSVQDEIVPPPQESETVPQTTVKKDDADIFSLKQWFASEVTDRRATYLKNKDIKHVRDALDSRRVESVAVALAACKDLSKTHLVSLLESYAESVDDSCDAWTENLKRHVTDLPSLLSDFLLPQEKEYKDFMVHVQDMPSILISMCLGAMLQETKQLTKDLVKDMMLRLALIGYLLFRSPPDYMNTQAKRQDFNDTPKWTISTSNQATQTDEINVSDYIINKQLRDTMVMNAERESETNTKVVYRNDKGDNSIEQQEVDTNVCENMAEEANSSRPVEEMSVEEHQRKEVREKLLEEFRENYDVDCRKDIPLGESVRLPQNPTNTIQIDHSYIQMTAAKQVAKDDDVKVSCPFCKWEFQDKDLTSEGDVNENAATENDQNNTAKCSDDTGTDTCDSAKTTENMDRHDNENATTSTETGDFGKDEGTNAMGDSTTEALDLSTTKNANVGTDSTKAHVQTTVTSVKPETPELDSTITNDENVAMIEIVDDVANRAQKEFDAHVKSVHCNANGRAYRETVTIFSWKGLWLDDLTAAELGQVFMCPFCFNVETVRVDHYRHIVSHENQDHYFTCFPCQQGFEDYATLTAHYASKHDARDIDLTTVQGKDFTASIEGLDKVIDYSETPAEAEFTFDYLDLCLEMEERNPGVPLFIDDAYPVFMAVSHGFKTSPYLIESTTAKGLFFSCLFLNCKVVFKTKQELLMHRLTNHTEESIAGYVIKHTKSRTQWEKYKLGPLIETCKKCGKLELGKYQLESHKTAKHPINAPIDCEKCRRVFYSKGALNRHNCRRTCEKCSKLFATRLGLKRHQCKAAKVTKAGDQRHQCTVCLAVFKTEKEFTVHCKIYGHTDALSGRRNTKMCKKCGRKFIGMSADYLYGVHVTQGNCNGALRKKSFPARKRQCPRCNKCFYHVERHAAHVIHVNCMNDPGFETPEKLQCYICQKIFTSLRALEEHLSGKSCVQTFEPIVMKPRPEKTSTSEETQDLGDVSQDSGGNTSQDERDKKTSRTPKPCERCGKVVSDLKKHQRYVNCNGEVEVESKRRLEKKPCKRCGIMLREDTLKRHVGLVNCLKDPHFVQDPDCLQRYGSAVCQKCQKVFSNAKTLNYHLAKVNCTNDPNFEKKPESIKSASHVNCPRCGVTVHKNRLAWHLRTINCNKDPNFTLPSMQCEKCGWYFSNYADHNRHKLLVNCTDDPNFFKHPSHEPSFACGKCGQLFGELDDVKEHQETVDCESGDQNTETNSKQTKEKVLTKPKSPPPAKFNVEQGTTQPDYYILVADDELNFPAGEEGVAQYAEYQNDGALQMVELTVEDDVEIDNS